MGFWGDLISIGGDVAGAFVGMPWLGTAATAIGGAVNSSGAAKSAANQQQTAGQQAAATFQPYVQGGNAAFNKALAMYGIPAPGTQSSIAPPAVAGAPPQQMTPRYGIDTTPANTPTNNMPVETPGRPPGIVPPMVTMNDYGMSGGSSYGAR